MTTLLQTVIGWSVADVWLWLGPPWLSSDCLWDERALSFELSQYIHFVSRHDDTRPEGYKTFLCSTQLNSKFVQLINVKMPTIVGILTFISMINTTPERLKARNFFICQYFSFYEQFKFFAQLSWVWKKFYNLGAWLLYLNCRPDVLDCYCLCYCLCVSSSRCRGYICILWLWCFLIIVTICMR